MFAYLNLVPKNKIIPINLELQPIFDLMNEIELLFSDVTDLVNMIESPMPHNCVIDGSIGRRIPNLHLNSIQLIIKTQSDLKTCKIKGELNALSCYKLALKCKNSCFLGLISAKYSP